MRWSGKPFVAEFRWVWVFAAGADPSGCPTHRRAREDRLWQDSEYSVDTGAVSHLVESHVMMNLSYEGVGFNSVCRRNSQLGGKKERGRVRDLSRSPLREVPSV
jgi:hypothetical protein